MCCIPEQTFCHTHTSLNAWLHWALQVNEGGLTSDEHAKRLEEYGPNKLPESTRNPILVYLGYMWNPLSWAMECAVILAVALLDYADFCLIIALLLTNATISYVEVGLCLQQDGSLFVQLSLMSGSHRAVPAAQPVSACVHTNAECFIAQAQLKYRAALSKCALP